LLHSACLQNCRMSICAPLSSFSVTDTAMSFSPPFSFGRLDSSGIRRLLPPRVFFLFVWLRSWSLCFFRFFFFQKLVKAGLLTFLLSRFGGLTLFFLRHEVICSSGIFFFFFYKLCSACAFRFLQKVLALPLSLSLYDSMFSFLPTALSFCFFPALFLGAPFCVLPRLFFSCSVS